MDELDRLHELRMRAADARTIAEFAAKKARKAYREALKKYLEANEQQRAAIRAYVEEEERLDALGSDRPDKGDAPSTGTPASSATEKDDPTSESA